MSQLGPRFGVVRTFHSIQELRPAPAHDLLADVEAWSKDNGGNIRQWSCRNQDDNSRQWRFFTAT
ncbi:hypothetical protein AB0C90_02065 [Streptomyces sp. NPDC048550]|uniref:hypothetical protein n=1 Tax=unclassified Streptomyces TaxID=2593676 RepID=UPI00343A4A30